MPDSELHMLKYWIDDKGITTAFADYYPRLAKTDPEIARCLRAIRRAKMDLMTRVDELVAGAEDASDA